MNMPTRQPETTKQHLLLASITEEYPLFLPTPGFTSFPRSEPVSLDLPAFLGLSPNQPLQTACPFLLIPTS